MTVFDKNIVPRLREAVVALGVFDGIHAGHKVIIEKTIDVAKQKNTKSVIITFKNHPKNLFFKEKGESPIRLLTSLEEKINILENMGVDYIYLIDFTADFSKLSAKQFLQQIVIDEIGASTIVVGRHHRFGHNDSDDNNDIDRISTELGISVIHIEGQCRNNMDIASSCIRKLIAEGNISTANLLLERPYSIFGKIVRGKGLGKQIGYPTANIVPINSHKIIPKEGVYIVSIEYHKSIYYGMMSIGSNPTVNESSTLTLEVNIFNFNKTIYGECVTIGFLHYLRSIRKFNSVDDLSEQLLYDKQESLKVLNLHKKIQI